MYSAKGSQAYAEVSLQTKSAGATPHQLIIMLFDGAHSTLLKARLCIEQGKVAERGKMISRAINIIENGLRSALDRNKGIKLADDLDSLYEYLTRTLLRANLNNDASLIEHVDELLSNVSRAWKEIQ